MPIVFKTTCGIFDRKAHIRRLKWHLQIVEQTEEIGISTLIKNNKTGIYGATLYVTSLCFFAVL